MLGQNNIISWNSMLQKTTALSSCEAEYMALKESAKESIYLNNMIKEFARLIKLDIENMVLFTDSESAMKLGENAEFHKRSKHIDIQYHFIRECIEEKRIILAYIPTKRQLADGFTKGVDNNKHKAFIAGMGLK
jgi:phosphotransacetylase